MPEMIQSLSGRYVPQANAHAIDRRAIQGMTLIADMQQRQGAIIVV